jgi:hypothetical protein
MANTITASTQNRLEINNIISGAMQACTQHGLGLERFANLLTTIREDVEVNQVLPGARTSPQHIIGGARGCRCYLPRRDGGLPSTIISAQTGFLSLGNRTVVAGTWRICRYTYMQCMGASVRGSEDDNRDPVVLSYDGRAAGCPCPSSPENEMEECISLKIQCGEQSSLSLFSNTQSSSIVKWF